MKSIFLFLATLMAFSVSSQKRTIDVSGFSELSFGIPGTLYLTQGNNESVTIECSDKVFEKIEFDLRGDRLVIKKEGKWDWRDGFRNADVDIYITMKDIEDISLSGSGNLKGENNFKTGDLRLGISGSGNIDVEVDSRNEVSFRISGSGSINVSGQAEASDARISGSGRLKAEDFEVRSFEASISGSGSCYITATEEITANISGSGNVYYNGNPDRLIGNSSGSGKIKKM